MSLLNLYRDWRALNEEKKSFAQMIDEKYKALLVGTNSVRNELVQWIHQKEWDHYQLEQRVEHLESILTTLESTICQPQLPDTSAQH